MPSSIRRSLNELPITLDDTYERILRGISKEEFQHAHRLFQCIVAATRPLRVEELAEIFAVEFDPNDVANLRENWRPENPEEAIFSACSSLITIINVRGSKTVHFSHFSVKEYMTSDRLQTSNIGDLHDYYITLELAHTVLARACIAVLLQMDETVDRERVATFPLAKYASEHWLDHARFEDVESRIQDALELLFNPKRPHLRACIWMHDVEPKFTHNPEYHSAAEQPPPLQATPLYYAVFCGFSELAERLIMTHGENVNAQRYDGRTPLHVASEKGHVDAVHVLLNNWADVGSRDNANWTPLHFASYEGNLEVVQLLLDHGADVNAQSNAGSTPVFLASESGHKEVVQLLLERGADVHVKGAQLYQRASEEGHHDIAQLLREYGAQ